MHADNRAKSEHMNTNWIKETENGVLLPIRAVPRAAKNGIQGLHGGALKIRLNTPPVDGKANRELVLFLSKTLGLPKAQIVLLQGKTGRNKLVQLTGITKEMLIQRFSLHL
jgi:uncharacterized protein